MIIFYFAQVKVAMKEVTNVQYVACMNPTAGSFHITPRMQRHFVTFALQLPPKEIVRYVENFYIECTCPIVFKSNIHLLTLPTSSIKLKLNS